MSKYNTFMKKKALWILLPLTAILLSFFLLQGYCLVRTSIHTKDKKDVKRLHYLFYTSAKKSKAGFSLSLDTSDSFSNHEILNNLVGTLVKYDIKGHFYPYLAEKWSFSEDKKKWQFKLKPNLKFDNGDPITAEGFVNHLQKKLLSYKKKKGGSLFERIQGFEDFIQGKSKHISGLFAVNDVIHFQFTSSPDDLLEILNMAYFGYWHKENTEEFIKKNQFISSAAYSLKDFQYHTAILSKRKDWFDGNTKAPQEIHFSKSSFTNEKLPSKRVIMQVGSLIPPIENLNNYQIATGTPSILTAMVLSPHKAPFKDVKLRRAFASKFKRALKKNPIASKAVSLTESFYFNSEPLPFTDYEDSLNLTGKMVVSMAVHLDKENTKKLKSLLEEILKPFDVEVFYEGVDTSDKKWFEKSHSNRYYDIRLTSIHSGSTHINDIIKMMFCTKLGVSFPDPSGRICHLVQEHEKEQASKNHHKERKKDYGISQSYRESFNKYLLEDAAVVPLFHTRSVVLYSKDLNITTTPVDLDMFPLELIQLED